MKILLLQPPSPVYMNVKRDYAGGMGVADPSTRATYGHDSGYITLPYMSLLYSTAILEKNFDVSFLDAQAENCDLDAVLRHVAAQAPDFLVMVVNLPSIYGDVGIAKVVKARFPKTKIVAMGTVLIPLYDLVAESAAFDGIIRGDPEAILPDMINALSNGSSDGKFEFRKGALTNVELARITDLDALPSLPYHLVPMERYWYHAFGKAVKFAAVFASRGCSFRCYYCPYPVGFGGNIVHRDPVKVVDEIEDLYRTRGVRGILFRDQVFTMEAAKTERLCNEIMRRGLDIEWVVETRLDRVNENLLKKMKAAGCKRIHYGLESGDPELFKSMGKDGVLQDMDKLLDNFRMTEEVGIYAHMFVLIGLIGETAETIEQTIKTIERIKPLTLQVSVVTPYPGTLLFDQAREKNLIVTQDWSKFTGFIPVMRTEKLTIDDLVRARERMIRRHRKSIFWKNARQKARLVAKYTADGSIFRRVARKAGGSSAKGIAPLLKGLACKAGFAIGIHNVYRGLTNRKLQNPVRILSLHRVIDDSKPLSDNDRLDLERGCLSLSEFKRRINYLKRHFRFISLGEYVDFLRTGHRPESNSVILTFDDGFRDVYSAVYPFLRAERIPFTAFITTGLIGRDGKMLMAEEIKEMARDPLVTWGAHSVNHLPLTELRSGAAEKEISDSKAQLEKMTGGEVKFFCYPDGKYSAEIQKLLKSRGFICACATGRDMNYGNVDLLALKRMPFDNEPFERFAFRMAGRV